MLVAPHIAHWDGIVWQKVEGIDECGAVYAGAADRLAALCGHATPESPWRLVVRPSRSGDWNEVADDVTTAAWRPTSPGTPNK